jgi:LPS-assembly protein
MSILNFGKNSPATLFSSLVIGSFLTLLTSNSAFAEKVSTEEWNISADKVVRYEDPNSIVATGNVILEKKEKLPPKAEKKDPGLTDWAELLGEETGKEPEVLAEDVEKISEPKYETTIIIKADWMVYDVELESIKAKGNLHIETDEDNLYAKEGTLNLTTETGKFKDATILREQDSLHLEGETIEKTGFDTYKIVDGWAITCKIEKGETPPWSFRSSDIDIKQGGYAVLKHARFNIRNVPVFYSPYMIVPIKNTRQTGFLFPEFSSSSSGGFGFDLPFFLNISESSDLTFFPEYYLDRGFMPGVEYRYFTDVNDKGMFTASYLDDALSDPADTEYYEDTGYTHDNSDRYWVRGKADHTFGNSWQTRTDIDIVSDQDYLQEFNSGTTGFESTNDRYLETFGRGFQNDTETLRKNTLGVLRSWSGMSLEAEFFTINDASTNASDTNTPLWKLPRIDYNGTLPTGFADMNLDWDTDYVNYWREDGIGGNRFDIRPSLSTPVPLGPYLESRAEIGIRDTLYFVQTFGDAEWDEDTTQNRFLGEFEADLATTLERDFFTQSGSGKTLRHQARPYVKYGYIQDVDQEDLPKFDDVDTVGEKNAVTYGIDNFLNRLSSNKSGEDSLADYATLQIEQAYDFRNDVSDEPFSDIYGKLRWKPFNRTALEYKTYYDVYDSQFNSHTFEGRVANSIGDYLSLEYSYKKPEEINQINAWLGATVFDKWLIQGGFEHAIETEETVRASGSLTYQALCWSLKFETKYTPADTTYFFMFNLANIGIPLGFDI